MKKILIPALFGFGLVALPQTATAACCNYHQKLHLEHHEGRLDASADRPVALSAPARNAVQTYHVHMAEPLSMPEKESWQDRIMRLRDSRE